MTRDEAEARSHDADVVADAARYGVVFCSVDRSIALHGRLDITEPWNEWEWPRRLAVLRQPEPAKPEPAPEQMAMEVTPTT